eukprot:c14386_g1_i1 orf=130-1071(+)
MMHSKLPPSPMFINQGSQCLSSCPSPLNWPFHGSLLAINSLGCCPKSFRFVSFNAFFKESRGPAVTQLKKLLPYGRCALDDAFGGRAMQGSGDSGSGWNSGSGGNGDDGQIGEPGDGAGQPSDYSIVAWYLMLLGRFPVSTKAVTAALITFFGDLFCQLAIEKSCKVDTKRIALFTLLGLILVAPTLHFWYLALSRWISGNGIVKVGVRLALDQFVFSPIFIGVFFSALLTLEGRPTDIIPKLHQDWLTSVITNWKIWIPFQFVNFLVVPQQLQVLAANVIALVWNIYLSFATHTEIVPSSEKKLSPSAHQKI